MTLSQNSEYFAGESLNVDRIRRDFPELSVKVNGNRLVYLDSAATSQKPMQVIRAVDEFYSRYNANIHRGVYKIAEEATAAYTESKEKVARLINANGIEEIVYVRNATEAINLVALGWAAHNISKGDHILISEMEHHSNIVPWIILSNRAGAVLDYVEIDKSTGLLDDNSLHENLEKSPKLVAITQASNVLGTINDVKQIAKLAHKRGAKVLVDAAQSVPHMKVDVRDIDSDFFAFSGHKMLAPTGIGVLHAKAEILDRMEPVFGGGDMIKSVEYHSYTPNDLPWKFEAGTANIEGGIGLGAAVDYLNMLGMDRIRRHEMEITKYALERLQDVSNVTVYGPSLDMLESRVGVVSFSLDDVHPHDVATIFDRDGVAIRAGHHCAMPLVTKVIGKPALSRMSFYMYNGNDDVDAAVKAIGEVKKIFRIK
ncbi:MAG: SufS family cysteine desulfurase [Candidatus Micrarchaeota archaeon]|nr:SufS family cysteine desulfurase [Candidatus Micrarchaeota archaeon]